MWYHLEQYTIPVEAKKIKIGPKKGRQLKTKPDLKCVLRYQVRGALPKILTQSKTLKTVPITLL